MKMNYSLPIAIVIMALGLTIIVIAFISPMLELKIALALAGAAFVSSGAIQLGQAQDKKRNDQKLEQLMRNLEEIKQAIQKEKEDESKGKGVVIADVIASGLKYYAENIAQPKKEEEDD
jgi:ABC-type transport system involved in cytochrome bd biosynthesis fused ATPase/permease subunit